TRSPVIAIPYFTSGVGEGCPNVFATFAIPPSAIRFTAGASLKRFRAYSWTKLSAMAPANPPNIFGDSFILMNFVNADTAFNFCLHEKTLLAVFRFARWQIP